jgi:hypothetical protein
MQCCICFSNDSQTSQKAQRRELPFDHYLVGVQVDINRVRSQPGGRFHEKILQGLLSDAEKHRPVWFGGADRGEAREDEFCRFRGEEPAKRVRLAMIDMWKPFRNVRNQECDIYPLDFTRTHIEIVSDIQTRTRPPAVRCLRLGYGRSWIRRKDEGATNCTSS